MTANRIHFLILGAAGLLMPNVLTAQMDPNIPPASATQPNQSPQQRQAASPSMGDSNPSPDMTTGMMKDKVFLRKAAEGGLAEVQLGKLAAQKGGSEDVKSFGQKMVDDHSVINKQLAEVADNLGVRLPQSPNKDDQAEYDKLNALTGDSFDTEYLTYMVKDHHKDMREFRMEAMNATDSELRETVQKASQTIREHMMMVDKLAKDKGIVLPGRRPQTGTQ